MKTYLRAASAEFKNLNSLVAAALLIAIGVVLRGLFIPVGENLRITFAFLSYALGGVIFGPLMGGVFGLCFDLVGFMLFPSGGFFFGYTISSICYGVVYGLFFYRMRLSVLRIAVCKFTVNLLINVGLGCLWSSMLYGKGFLYFAATSSVKNLILLPIEIVMLFVVMRALTPFLVQKKKLTTTKITWF